MFTQVTKYFHIKIGNVFEHIRQLVHVGKMSVMRSLGMIKRPYVVFKCIRVEEIHGIVAHYHHCMED